jgi:hypothetical protein
MKLIPKNWDNFQHYKHRSPPWIKLHKNLLDDMDYQRLPIASKALAPMLWLLASEAHDGEINKTTEEIAFRLRMLEEDVIVAIKPLINMGFFIDADNALANCFQDATTETEKSRDRVRDRVETKKPEGFDLFWEFYDKKRGKPKAEKEWLKANIDENLLKTVLEQAKKYAQTTEKQFRKDPERWIKGRHWEDEIFVIEKPKIEKQDKQWMFSDAGIEAKAREVGIAPTGYDTYQTLKEKILLKLAKEQIS